MLAQDLMSHPAITCHVNDPLDVAARLMWDHDCGAVMVVRDQGEIAGVLTDRDICMAAYTQGKPLDAILAHSAMSRHVASARPDQTLGELEHLMATHAVRRIPVVDDHDRPIGVVSLNDLVIEASQPDSRLAAAAPRLIRVLAAICQPRRPRRRAA